MEKHNSSLFFTPNIKEETLATTLNQATSSLDDLLWQFANTADFATDLQLAFGNNIKTDLLSKSWQAGKFTIPKIEVVNRIEINNAHGAFSRDTNKIYLAQEFLLVNQNNLDVVNNVLLEEYGHFVDSQLNDNDAPGDEGAIFAAVVQGEDLSESELQQLKNEDDTATVTLDGETIEIEQSFTNLINRLGGSAGFGEQFLPRHDDVIPAEDRVSEEPNTTEGEIDLTTVFGEDGLKFYGESYTKLYVNNNGNVTFDGPLSTYTPSDITSLPIIAPFFADVDTRENNIETSPGGNSQGTNLVYYDLNSDAGEITITWDDVGKFSNETTPNAFQLILRDLTEEGAEDFEIEFRYEEVQWTVGGASEDVYARVGFSGGDGENFYELPFSNNQEQLLQLEAGTNADLPGRFVFQVIDGVPQINEKDYSLLSTATVHRFYEHEQGFHFYTSDENEVQVVKGRSAAGRQGYEYEYEYEKFRILTDDRDAFTGETIEGAKPIYRFFNTETGSHLYTMDEVEKANIQDNLTNYNFEGVKFYAFESKDLTSLPTIPVFRMLNGQSGTHLFTTDRNEIDYIKENLSHFSMESDGGVAFYVFEV